MTFGQVVAKARHLAGLSQKELAGRVAKEDGRPISAQYLNDIEHDRRGAPSDHLIRQLARVLKIKVEYLYYLAGELPADLQGHQVDEATVVAAYEAFRRRLRVAKE
jgi:transcriptional regulator with XRE-family HTH domain